VCGPITLKRVEYYVLIENTPEPNFKDLPYLITLIMKKLYCGESENFEVACLKWKMNACGMCYYQAEILTAFT